MKSTQVRYLLFFYLIDLLVSLNEGKKAEIRKSVALTTIHQSKGLEWPVGKSPVSLLQSIRYSDMAPVFLVRCNSGVIPSVKATTPAPTNEKTKANPSSSMEEERRLLYGTGRFVKFM